MRLDFVHESHMMGLEFSDEELAKIFEYICGLDTKASDSRDQQVQQLDGGRRGQASSFTRFKYKNLHDAIMV